MPRCCYKRPVLSGCTSIHSARHNSSLSYTRASLETSRCAQPTVLEYSMHVRHTAWCNSMSAQWKVYSAMTASETFLSLTLWHENLNRFQVTSKVTSA
jgi:hypothetical protein